MEGVDDDAARQRLAELGLRPRGFGAKPTPLAVGLHAIRQCCSLASNSHHVLVAPDLQSANPALDSTLVDAPRHASPGPAMAVRRSRRRYSIRGDAISLTSPTGCAARGACRRCGAAQANRRKLSPTDSHHDRPGMLDGRQFRRAGHVAITERAMRGESNSSRRARVARQGLGRRGRRCSEPHRADAGGRELVRPRRLYLLSGGFTLFTAKVAR